MGSIRYINELHSLRVVRSCSVLGQPESDPGKITNKCYS